MSIILKDIMQDSDIHEVIKRLKRAVAAWQVPIVTEYAQQKRTPYHILISTIISLRTKDQVTAEASKRLFKLADTFQDSRGRHADLPGNINIGNTRLLLENF